MAEPYHRKINAVLEEVDMQVMFCLVNPCEAKIPPQGRLAKLIAWRMRRLLTLLNFSLQLKIMLGLRKREKISNLSL